MTSPMFHGRSLRRMMMPLYRQKARNIRMALEVLLMTFFQTASFQKGFFWLKAFFVQKLPWNSTMINVVQIISLLNPCLVVGIWKVFFASIATSLLQRWRRMALGLDQSFSSVHFCWVQIKSLIFIATSLTVSSLISSYCYECAFLYLFSVNLLEILTRGTPLSKRNRLYLVRMSDKAKCKVLLLNSLEWPFLKY